MAMDSVVYLNGQFVPEGEARISVLDHGFLYGDGVFESLSAEGGRVVQLDEHIERLFESAGAIRLKVPLTKEGLRQAVLETLRRNGAKDAYIRIVLSRGPGYPLLDPRIPNRPTLVILLHDPAPPEATGTTYRSGGLRLKTAAVRKTPSICLDARIKSLNYLNHILARWEAIEAGADEALLLDVEGRVAEAPGENIFIVKGGVLKTPRPQNVLNGITRRKVLSLAAKAGTRAEEVDLTLQDLYTADEVFLTSSFGGIHPVASVDGKAVVAPVPGPITRKLKQILQRFVEEEEPIG